MANPANESLNKSANSVTEFKNKMHSPESYFENFENEKSTLTHSHYK
jgi:hypothetical protein